MNIIESSKNLMNYLQLPLKEHVFSTPVISESLLLTGATGFLGIHLLEKLVNSQLYKNLFIIVRNKKKLQHQVAYYGIPNFSWDNITIIEGDLNSLPVECFPNVTTVIHSAAQIHCIKTLKQLWQDNVATTAKICQIYQNTANINFISTLSVFVSSNQSGIHTPDPLPVSEDYLLYGGYAQSKFICEQLIEQVGGNIIRLGLLTGSTYLSRFPTKDFFSQVITTLHTLGCYPQDYEPAWVDMTPVDIAASKIINYLSENYEESIIHIANKSSLNIKDIVQLLDLKAVAPDIFEEKIKDLDTVSKNLMTFAFFKTRALKENFHLFNIDLFQSTNHFYSIEQDFPIDNISLLNIYIGKLLQNRSIIEN